MSDFDLTPEPVVHFPPFTTNSRCPLCGRYALHHIKPRVGPVKKGVIPEHVRRECACGNEWNEATE